MSVPKPAPAIEHDPVLAALENAPLDPDCLTPDEAAELDARMARGAGRGRTAEEVLAELAARAKREG
jgi:hypothetical protein